MSSRFIQSTVSEEDHIAFKRFAGANDMSLAQLIETAVKEYIRNKRKEDLKGEQLEMFNESSGL